MLTYVINTSENRSMDSDRLFDLAGYNKIRWMNCPLSDVARCAQHISEKQNVLGADQFRIAVLVDFYNFDRVRVPYGRRGFKPEVGVDISLYLPFIETYLIDHLIVYLEKRELCAADFEVYYVQNSKVERYAFLNNEIEQLREILTGDNSAETEEPEPEDVLTEVLPGAPAAAEDPADADAPEEAERFPAFRLYCTPNVSLTFRLSEYPYGEETMTLPQFARAFSIRVNQNYELRRHFYISGYGGGRARAAFDTMTLSLYLIRTYEREESILSEEVLEIPRMDAENLKNVLVTSWNKIVVARNAARGGASVYYSLKDNVHIDTEALKPKYKSGYDIFDENYEQKAQSLTPEDLYRQVAYYNDRSDEQLAADRRAELDRLMNDYLRNRDDMKAVDVRAELEEGLRNGSLVTTHQFPSEEEYIHALKEKEEEISVRFGNVLAATYVEVDFQQEKKRAFEAFEKYKQAKACLHRNMWGDVALAVFALLAAVIPYAVLQLTKFNVKFFVALALGAETLAMFFFLFVLSALLQYSLCYAEMARAKRALKQAYQDAYAKERDAMVQLRSRYTEDLLFIERTRYELRQLRYLYDLNRAKEENVKRHRVLLEELEDRLASMLNNLDVEPVLDPEEDVSGEFDLNRPILSRENRIYRIFSLETIEKLFKRKGREQG